MTNIVFLEVYTSEEQYNQSSYIKLPLESFLTYCVYKWCDPQDVDLYFVYNNRDCEQPVVTLKDTITYMDKRKLPWQVSCCLYPVFMFGDTITTGLCAVARHLSKYRSNPQSVHEHQEGILGFRKGCLQAPNEVSIWTKFCEVDIIKTVKEVLSVDVLPKLSQNLVRFENHLSKPVRVHNIFKVAREFKKINIKSSDNTAVIVEKTENDTRIPKIRKWKSNKKEQEVNPTKIEDLDLNHQFAEGPFLTLADLLLFPSYYVLVNYIGDSIFESQFPLTSKWYKNLISIQDFESILDVTSALKTKCISVVDNDLPITENVSLYKCDPKRHNPKKRLFTKEDDIEDALTTLTDGMEITASANKIDDGIKWSEIPDCANPYAGHLPDERIVRKSQQLENLALSVLEIAKDGDLIVDFCSGSGHLGILIACLLPNCTVILLENKEQSLLRARKRVHDASLQNVYFFQCNLDFFIGKFDIGVALHACGIATDLVLDKCLKSNAKFVLCPCCYGSLHATDRLVYPRSNVFRGVSINQYLCIGHAADQTHEEHPLTVRGDKCMAVIDSDRGRLAEELGYKVTLSRLKPLACTPKNNLLIGVPSS